MPQLVELRVGGCRDRGMPVTQRDDRDPAAEVEVRPTHVVPDAAALTADDRHVGACVRRQDCRLQETVGRGAHAGTSVAPIEARTPPRAACTAAISFGTIPPSKTP